MCHVRWCVSHEKSGIWMHDATHYVTEFVTHMNESCHTHEWAIHRVCLTWKKSCHTYESCRTYIMSHIWMRHVRWSSAISLRKSCCTYERVISHIWMRHVRWSFAISLHKSCMIVCLFESRAPHTATHFNALQHNADTRSAISLHKSCCAYDKIEGWL